MILASVFTVVLIAMPAAKQRIVNTVATAKKGKIDQASGEKINFRESCYCYIPEVSFSWYWVEQF